MANRPAITMRMKGVNPLAWAFAELALQMSDADMRDDLEEALVESAQPVVVDAQGRVRKKSLATMRTIMASRHLHKDHVPLPHTMQGFARAYVGAKAGSLGPIIEFGSGPRVWKGSRKRVVAPKSTGRMPAFPFMRPAWDSGWRGILERFGRHWGKRLEARAAAIGIVQQRKMESEP